ncbi:hypothetical protein [Bradyrhizobium sp. JR3.5]
MKIAAGTSDQRSARGLHFSEQFKQHFGAGCKQRPKAKSYGAKPDGTNPAVPPPSKDRAHQGCGPNHESGPDQPYYDKQRLDHRDPRLNTRAKGNTALQGFSGRGLYFGSASRAARSTTAA